MLRSSFYFRVSRGCTKNEYSSFSSFNISILCYWRTCSSFCFQKFLSNWIFESSDVLGFQFHAMGFYWRLYQPIQVDVRILNNGIRTELNLPAQNEIIYKDLPQFCTISEHVVKRPTDWPNNVHQTGYWLVSAEVQLLRYFEITL
jgi:hypothetical protein